MLNKNLVSFKRDMMTTSINDSNVNEYAWRHYQNAQMYHFDEFQEDMKTFHYVKRLLTRFQNSEDINHQLTLNHIITLVNLFGPEATMKLLHYFIPQDQHPLINTFLFYLSILPRTTDKVNLDAKIYGALQRL